MQDKHFLNDPSTLVLDSLRGLCACNPQLALDSTNKVVYISSPDQDKVALLCGGGSGHEPAHAGFVGHGILTAAVCGNIFASPSASQVRRAIDLVDNKRGTVIIVKNYTGDVLNFGLTKEQYAAALPEKSDRIRFVIVADDVAVGNAQGELVGRRGLAGTVLVYKIAGALAQRGASLDDVYDIAQWVSTRIGTVGVGLEHCHVPGTAAADSYLAVDEIEIGMGIHGEPGYRRVSPVPSLKTLVPQLLELLTSTTDPDRSYLPFQGHGKDSVILLINNLGGTSELELYGIVSEVRCSLEALGISIRRILCGTFMTSLSMPGFSITLLLLPFENEHCPCNPDLLISLLDQETDAPGWKWSSKSIPASTTTITASNLLSSTGSQQTIAKLVFPNPNQFTESIERASRALIAAEPEITRMDSIAGDGDCGLTLKSGATAVIAKLADGTITGTDIITSILTIAQIAEEHMGGTSGALYSIFFSTLAQGLSSECPCPPTTPHSSTPPTTAIDHTIWARALSSSLTKLYTYTRARPPSSRTLIDSLHAFISTFEAGSLTGIESRLAAGHGQGSPYTRENLGPSTELQSGPPRPVYTDSANHFASAVEAAVSAAERTRDATFGPRAGRSAYVEGDRLQRQHVPDPGAWGVKIILENL